MNMFTFTFECGYTNTKVKHEVEGETLDEILSAFENFLKGSGYLLDGVLDVVDPDDQDIDFDFSEKIPPYEQSEEAK